MFRRLKNTPVDLEIETPVAPPASPSIPDPGPPIVLVLKTFIDGTSNIQYKGDPSWAVQTLRDVANSIEEGINE